MNPFPHIDPYNIQFNTNNDGFMPPVSNSTSFPIDMVTTSSVNTTPDMIGLSTIDNDIMANIPLSQAGFYPPMSNTVNSMSPNMMDNQQAHMVMMLMQQQQQQQQQYNLLLQQQQQQQLQQLHLQQQQQQQLQLQQQQQHQFQPPQKRPSSFQGRQPLNSQTPSPQWFMKQQQAKMMAAQEKLKSSGVPSPSYSASSSPMHSSPLLDQSSSSPQVASASIIPSSTSSAAAIAAVTAATPPSTMIESDAVLGKRVELVLTINQEIIRLLLEHQQAIIEPREPDLTMYKNRLQTNLTYLATMADISMTKPDESLKIPTPPDLSPLPPPFTMTAQKIHKLLSAAQQLFPPSALKQQPLTQPHMMDEPSMSPFPQRQQHIQQQQQQRQFQLQQQQMMMMRQQQQMRQSGMNSVGSNNSSSSSSFNSIMSPQQMHHALLSKNNVEQDVMNPFINEEALSMMYQQH